jgi:hypothetical protein
MEVLFWIAMSAAHILCFMIGAKVGQKVVKGEEVKLPSVDPLKAYREQQDRKEAQKEQDMVDAILRNVEAYNGTADGQKDLPRG